MNDRDVELQSLKSFIRALLIGDGTEPLRSCKPKPLVGGLFPFSCHEAKSIVADPVHLYVACHRKENL